MIAKLGLATPAAKTSAAASWNTSDIITLTAHGFTTGLKGQVTSSDTLPTGISAATDYFVHVITANTIYLYDTYANAIAGGSTGRVNITNVGAGNHTFTPTAADVDVKLQASTNGVDAADIEDFDYDITATVNKEFSINPVIYPYYRLSLTVNAGVVSFEAEYSSR